ncbi:butyrophilin subfamily 1 member A1-like [Myripristis murdjan]|uniref:butyrophilin subfamily 1 member A1-like n=1 Tax=Myripristis murdjan TaxID=586833 RepID=UPI00117649A1|nr:butyrophilin subfamily 1 member A1-like [Myripristis murdjan]XP_029932796.1 butyrophilin subfamily 1 member A1-like [Myripristis murdjan]
MLHLSLLAALFTSHSTTASENIAVSVSGVPVSVHQGHTATLPCWLNPPKSAESLDVCWFLADTFDAPLLSYQGRQVHHGSQHVDRAAFGLRDATSRGLKAGDVSLKLVNVTLRDAGEYTCYVSSDQGYDKGTVQLNVIKVGSPPVLSPQWNINGTVNVSCSSEGWYPKPWLRWSEQGKVETPKVLTHNTETSGLVSVHSSRLVSSSSKVFCSIGLHEEENWEAALHLQGLVQTNAQGPGPSPVLFGMTFAALLIVSAILAYFLKNRGSRSKSDPGGGEDPVREHLLPTGADVGGFLEEARKHYVNVTLDNTDNRYLKTKDGRIVRDGDVPDVPDGALVTGATSIKGASGFSSGRHYWEVLLGNEKVGFKKSWWIGVTSVTGSLEGLSGLPRASHGYWFLSSDATKGLWLNTEPVVLLPVQSTPQTLGVYLDYDSGKLSFYSVGDKRHIATVECSFKGEVFPFFNPGKGDAAPMEIVHREEVESSHDEHV